MMSNFTHTAWAMGQFIVNVNKTCDVSFFILEYTSPRSFYKLSAKCYKVSLLGFYKPVDETPLRRDTHYRGGNLDNLIHFIYLCQNW